MTVCHLCHRPHAPGIDLCSINAIHYDAAHALHEQAELHDEAIRDFDVKQRTDERGATYGHPLDHFGRTTGMLNALGFRELVPGVDAEAPLEPLDWPFVMICDKLARLRETPDHRDGWEDIMGYARTALMILDRLEAQDGATTQP